MANATQVFSKFLEQLAKGQVDFSTQDIRVALVMTNSTAGEASQVNVDTVGAISVLDEFDGAGYSSGGVALTGEAVTEDETNDRAEFDATDADFGGLSAGTRNIAGYLIYKFVSTFGGSLPIAFVLMSATPDGSNFTIQWNAEGILQFTDGN